MEQAKASHNAGKAKEIDEGDEKKFDFPTVKQLDHYCTTVWCCGA